MWNSNEAASEWIWMLDISVPSSLRKPMMRGSFAWTISMRRS
jgi:hypothetical protein